MRRPRIGRCLRLRCIVALALVPTFVAMWRSLLLASTAAERHESQAVAFSQSSVVLSARRAPQYTAREMDGGNSANVTYFCGGAEEKKHAYSGSWLASGERFRLGVQMSHPWFNPALRPGDMKKAGFSMAKLPWQAGGRHGNMEGASFMMMKRCCRREDEGAQRTANLFDFWVEHLSAYERMIDLMHVRDPSLLDELIDSIATRLRVRERALRERWWRAWRAPSVADRARRGVAVMPFYGAGVATGHSVVALRLLYLNITFWALAGHGMGSPFGRDVAVAVCTPEDAHAVLESGLPRDALELLRLDRSVPTELPQLLGVAAVVETQRRFVTGEWPYRWVLYTEADQVVHLPRPSLVLNWVSDRSRASLLTPHRLLPRPRDTDFAPDLRARLLASNVAKRARATLNSSAGAGPAIRIRVPDATRSPQDARVPLCCFERRHCVARGGGWSKSRRTHGALFTIAFGTGSNNEGESDAMWNGNAELVGHERYRTCQMVANGSLHSNPECPRPHPPPA